MVEIRGWINEFLKSPKSEVIRQRSCMIYQLDIALSNAEKIVDSGKMKKIQLEERASLALGEYTNI